MLGATEEFLCGPQHKDSSISKGGQVPSECMDAAKIIYPSIVEFGAPKDWTWIIACDEAAWRRLGKECPGRFAACVPTPFRPDPNHHGERRARNVLRIVSHSEMSTCTTCSEMAGTASFLKPI